MKGYLIKAAAIFLVFFVGACSLVAVDNVCLETTRYGGNLLFNVEKLRLFN